MSFHLNSKSTIFLKTIKEGQVSFTTTEFPSINGKTGEGETADHSALSGFLWVQMGNRKTLSYPLHTWHWKRKSKREKRKTKNSCCGTSGWETWKTIAFVASLTQFCIQKDQISCLPTFGYSSEPKHRRFVYQSFRHCPPYFKTVACLTLRKYLTLKKWEKKICELSADSDTKWGAPNM